MPKKTVHQLARGANGVLASDQDRVARALNISPRTLRESERSAFAKIRRHPEMMELWAAVRVGGIPPQEDVAAQVAEYQRGLSEWWEVYDRLNSSPETEEEALECLKMIKAFQAKLTFYLEKTGR